VSDDEVYKNFYFTGSDRELELLSLQASNLPEPVLNEEIVLGPKEVEYFVAAKLTKLQMTCMVRYYVDRVKMTQIAKELNISLPAVSSYIRYSKRKLKPILYYFYRKRLARRKS